MKFEHGDETDKKLVDVLFHEFIKCEKSFDAFVYYAGNNIMGDDRASIKLNSYNAYSDFLSRLYEFYVGCYKREHKNTKSIDHLQLDLFFNCEVEKLLRSKRNSILSEYAPEWENYISSYEGAVPEMFGKNFRDIRNNTSHADFRRAGDERIELMDFYNNYHKYVYLLYSSAQLAWSEKTNKNHKIEHIEKFTFLYDGN